MQLLLRNGIIVNEGKIYHADIFIKDGFIEKIGADLNPDAHTKILDLEGKIVLPGVIDDQVHFREPGLTHKANIYTEAKAAVAGGTTSFMEMPNTVPNTLSQELLAEKYTIAANSSLANYSFYMGVSNDNLEEVLKTNPNNICGIKIFMGSSTGNMLVDNPTVLEKVFAQSPTLIATHCEDETSILANVEQYKMLYGENVPAKAHPEIRNAEACWKSSAYAVSLAKKHHTRLHVLHISTADEISLFDNTIPLAEKKITAEVCVHHLWFSKDDYEKLGFLIKCNPAIKEKRHQEALFEALMNDYFDVIATDHAPHTTEEKAQNYWKAPSGLPLVQHSLQMMLAFYQQGRISLEKIAQKMAHNVAICFQIEKRGFIREGYWADLAIVDLAKSFTVSKNNILYKCAWSPLEQETFGASIYATIVSGHLAYLEGVFDESKKGQRLLFERY
ncbi:MAG: dihydroorotase [Thermonemataceae bacterium]|nr:dihydroorotase [Thermonemataceae bacterium]